MWDYLLQLRRNILILFSYFLLFSCKKSIYKVETSQIDSNFTIINSEKRIFPAQKPEINFRAKKNFVLYSVDQGLSSNKINDLKEDFFGNIWIATEKGVNKFDGTEYSHYLPEYEVTCIEIDNDSNLWFGTALDGIIKYDGKKFVQFGEKDGLPDYAFRTIFKDKNGKLWFGSKNNGVATYDGKSFTKIDLKQRSYGNSVRNVYEDKNGLIWITTFGGGVFKHDGKNLTNYKVENINNNFLIDSDLHLNKFMAIAEDKKGRLWLGSRFRGLYLFENDTLKEMFSEYLKNFPTSLIKDMISDQLGFIWISTDKGLFKFDGENFTSFHEKDGLADNQPNNLFFDSGRNLWITNNQGVNEYSESAFEYISFPSNNSMNLLKMNGIASDKNNKFWLVTNQGLLKCDSNLQPLDEENQALKSLFLKSDNFTGIVIDSANNIWVSTFGTGIIKYKEGKQPDYYKGFGLDNRNNFFTSVCKNSRNQIFFGGLEGLVIHSGSALKNIGLKDGLKNYEIASLGIDHQDNVWIGAETGISIYRNDSIIDPVELQKMFFTSIHKGISKDEMLLGTKYYGLWKYNINTKVIEKYTEENGLLSNTISSIYIDDLSNVWIGTDNGVNLWKNENYYKKNTHTNLFVNYGREEGFISIKCSPNAVYGENKSIYWATLKNITKFNYTDETQNNIKPRILLKSVKIFFKDIDWNNLEMLGGKDGVNPSKGVNKKGIPNQLALNYNQNHITFSFVGIDWKYPSSLKYSFILENVDQTWSDPNYKNEVTYSGLAPGDYTFRVVSYNKNMVKSRNEEVFHFTVTPPFWKAWWFYVIILAFLLICVYFYIKTREKVLKERQKFLESEVQTRTVDLLKEKEIVEKQNQKIRESIEYARKIQEAILPKTNIFQKHFTDHFVLFKPKDIVSGDFYWIQESINKVIIAVVDCTGHGVPGAFMSIIGKNLLDKIVRELYITQPNEILNQLNIELLNFLDQNKEKYYIKDGMDIAILSVHKQTKELEFAGSYNPLYVVQNDELMELKSDKISIGDPKNQKENLFSSVKLQLSEGDVLYLFTDGFPDQKGGINNKKFFYAPFRELLFSMYAQPMENQMLKLEQTITEFIGNNEQTDDICVIGVRL